MPRRRLAALITLSLVVVACDIGDGTTLQDPVAPTTLPPIDTTPLPSVAIDDPPITQTALADSVLVGSTPTPSGDAQPFRVVTPWADGAPIDVGFTCDGAGQIPTVSWTGVPDGTVELAVSLVNEADLNNGRPFVHWAVAGIDPTVGQILPGELPPGAFEAINFFGDVGYGPPCPDPGTTGVYVLRLFAVGQQVESGFDVPASDLLDIVESVSFAVASSSGNYTR